MVKDSSDQLAILAAKGQHRELRIERPGWPNGIVARADPEDRVVLQQQPAVLAYRRFLAQPEVHGGGAKLLLRLLHCFHDAAPHLPAKDFIALIAVHRNS